MVEQKPYDPATDKNPGGQGKFDKLQEQVDEATRA